MRAAYGATRPVPALHPVNGDAHRMRAPPTRAPGGHNPTPR
ncbi:hypothetical protein [Streptomyces sp. CB02923]|nr:hypothetical protein [Streptomyces sp. CB02923]